MIDSKQKSEIKNIVVKDELVKVVGEKTIGIVSTKMSIKDKKEPMLIGFPKIFVHHVKSGKKFSSIGIVLDGEYSMSDKSGNEIKIIGKDVSKYIDCVDFNKPKYTY